MAQEYYTRQIAMWYHCLRNGDISNYCPLVALFVMGMFWFLRVASGRYCLLLAACVSSCQLLIAIQEHRWPLPGRHSGTSLVAAWGAFGSVTCGCLAVIRWRLLLLSGRNLEAFLVAAWPQFADVSCWCLAAIWERPSPLFGTQSGTSLALS